MDMLDYNYMRFFATFALVIGLILLMGWVLRRYAPGHRHVKRPGEDRRLDVLEMLPLDAKNRLLLIRRDQTEHLLLVGSEEAQVVETGITPQKDSG